MFCSFHFGNFVFMYFRILVIFYVCLLFLLSTQLQGKMGKYWQDRNSKNIKNKQTEHIVKEITQLKWRKNKKRSYQKWNEQDT